MVRNYTIKLNETANLVVDIVRPACSHRSRRRRRRKRRTLRDISICGSYLFDAPAEYIKLCPYYEILVSF